MKKTLRKHTEDILEALDSPGLTVHVSDCEVDPVPAFIYMQEKRSFLICCAYKAAIPDPAWLKRLENFIGKELFMSAREQDTFIYWFESKPLEPATHNDMIKKVSTPSNTRQQNDEFITHTNLPEYIDRYIFDALKATYAPNYTTFSDNLGHTKQNVLVYLGSYFPRSYAESFCIFNNMLQNPILLTALQKKSELSILSIGCGTGGDLLGLLSLITEKHPEVEQISIQAVDGNAEALSILKEICEGLRRHWPFQLSLNTHIQTFEGKISAAFLENIENKFDFILSFKMIGELLRNSDMRKESYYDFCKAFLPHLSDGGICVVLDVTTQTNGGNYLPILLNAQMNMAIRELKSYKTLLPLPCNLHEGACSANDCFSQKTFTVTHRQHSKDKSKVCYRVIAHKAFCKNIKVARGNVKYNIGMIQRKPGDDSYDVKICQHTCEWSEEHDGYNLPR